MFIYVVIDELQRIVAMSESQISMPNYETHRIEIESDHPVLTNSEGYCLIDGSLILNKELELAKAKDNKVEELRLACQVAIEKGFDYRYGQTLYHFSLDSEAQFNFNSTYQLMNDNLVEKVAWTVTVDDVYTRLEVDKDMMKELSLLILQHKTTNISKLRDVLTVRIQNATTVSEVESIRWSDERN